MYDCTELLIKKRLILNFTWQISIADQAQIKWIKAFKKLYYIAILHILYNIHCVYIIIPYNINDT